MVANDPAATGRPRRDVEPRTHLARPFRYAADQAEAVRSEAVRSTLPPRRQPPAWFELTIALCGRGIVQAARNRGIVSKLFGNYRKEMQEFRI